LTRSLKDLIPTGLKNRRNVINKSYIFTAERTIIWDENALTSPKKRKRSKLPLLRRRKKTMLPTTELSVIITTAVSTGQKRMPQAGIQNHSSQKTSQPC